MVAGDLRPVLFFLGAVAGLVTGWLRPPYPELATSSEGESWPSYWLHQSGLDLKMAARAITKGAELPWLPLREQLGKLVKVLAVVLLLPAGVAFSAAVVLINAIRVGLHGALHGVGLAVRRLGKVDPAERTSSRRSYVRYRRGVRLFLGLVILLAVGWHVWLIVAPGTCPGSTAVQPWTDVLRRLFPWVSA